MKGKFQLGTDLSKANVEINDSTIHVTVNKPTVLSNSIDESSIEVYDETKYLIYSISVSDYKAFAVEQKEKALSEAKKKGINENRLKRTQKKVLKRSFPLSQIQMIIRLKSHSRSNYGKFEIS